MNSSASAFIKDICENAPIYDKESVIRYITSKYNLTLDRRVYYCRYFAVRFSYSKNGAFSNTVLSLSALQKYDKIPFFVVLVRGNGTNLVYLANSTFISKISHSSKELTMNNIKGSFNGSDIIKSYAGIKNSPEHFNELFALHEGLDWEDNLERLVDASSAIKPKSQKFNPDEIQINNIFASITRAADDEIRNRLKEMICDENKRLPEFTTKDELGDYERVFINGHTYTDIKTKVIYLDSAPKAYNVDKFLQKMADEDSIFLFFFIGISQEGIFNTALCSVYHNELIDASVIQHHWAGRSTRGVVQFAGKTLNHILSTKNFKNQIDSKKATDYLKMLLER